MRLVAIIFSCLWWQQTTSQLFARYIKDIVLRYESRSLVLIRHNMQPNEENNYDAHWYELVGVLYGMERPLYNLNLEELGVFNGKYHHTYDINITFEESKIYFMYLDDFQDFNDTLTLVRNIYFWRDRDRILILTNQDILDTYFEACFKYFIINVSIIQWESASDEANHLTAYTYNPFAKTFLLTLDNPGEVFQNKFMDLHGHPIRISMFDDIINSIPSAGEYRGLDGVMSRTLSQHLNATYIYVYPTKYPNFDKPLIDRQMKDVHNRVVDVGFNTRYVKPIFENVMEGTYPHERDGLKCLVPIIEVNTDINIGDALSTVTWILTFVISVGFFAYNFLLRKDQDAGKIALTTIQVLLNKSVKEMPIVGFRHALLAYVCTCFFFNILLLSQLTSMMTAVKVPQQIDTVEALAETTYDIITLPRFKIMLNNTLSPDTRKKIVSRIDPVKDEWHQIAEIKKCIKNLVVICKNHIAAYSEVQKENYPEGKQFYRIMKDDIFPSISCYVVWYGSPFLERISTLMRRMVEAGIVDKVQKETWNEFSDGKEAQGVVHQRRPLSLSNMKMVFSMYLAGLVMSVVVFLVEQFWNRRSRIYSFRLSIHSAKICRILSSSTKVLRPWLYARRNKNKIK